MIENEAPSTDKILVEVFSMPHVHTPVEELVRAVANSERWRGRLDIRMMQVEHGTDAVTPYGPIAENTVVVSGTHVIKGTDYWALYQALEDSADPMPI